jgi:hypothetical protein
MKREVAATQKDRAAASERAAKFRGRRGREPSEETAGQPAAIVDHDAPASNAGLIWNHFNFLAQWLPPRQSIDAGQLLLEIGMPQQKSAG